MPLDIDPKLKPALINSIQQELLRRKKEQAQFDWSTLARPNQCPPPGNWMTWVILAGRGFGKTRTGAETLRRWVKEGHSKHIAIIGETERETRQIMMEGPSGLLAIHSPSEKLQYEPSKGQLTWSNGATAFCYSGDHYNQLRGPQFDTAWVDELAKFQSPRKLWEQLMFCLRIGEKPRVIVTTTPRPDPFLKELLAQQDTILTHGTTFENKCNLAPHFLKSMKEKLLHTRLGRQELMAELLEDIQGALWTHEMVEKAQILYKKAPLQRVVIAIDPAVSHHHHSDETGIIAAGRTPQGQAIVLDDFSLKAPPLEWAQQAIKGYHSLKADRIVAEVNMGGALVEQMIRSVDPSVSYQAVRATRGKMVRAEPIVALYEQGKVTHAKPLPQLAHQLTTYVPGHSKSSPDRMDALVWALTELMLGKKSHFSSGVWSP